MSIRFRCFVLLLPVVALSFFSGNKVVCGDEGASGDNESECVTLRENATIFAFPYTIAKAFGGDNDEPYTFSNFSANFTVLNQIGCYFSGIKMCSGEDFSVESIVAGNILPHNDDDEYAKFTMIELLSGENGVMEGFIDVETGEIMNYKNTKMSLTDSDAVAYGITFATGNGTSSEMYDEDDDIACPTLETEWTNQHAAPAGATLLHGNGTVNNYPSSFFTNFTIAEQIGCNFAGTHSWTNGEYGETYQIAGTIIVAPTSEDDENINEDIINIVMVEAPSGDPKSESGRIYATIDYSSNDSVVMHWSYMGQPITDYSIGMAYDTDMMLPSSSSSSGHNTSGSDDRSMCDALSLHEFWTGSTYDVLDVFENMTSAPEYNFISNFTIKEQYNCTFVATNSWGLNGGEFYVTNQIGLITKIDNDEGIIEFKMLDVTNGDGADTSYMRTDGVINTKDGTMHWASSGLYSDGSTAYVIQQNFAESIDGNDSDATTTNSTSAPTDPHNTSDHTDGDCNSILDAICGMENSKFMCQAFENIIATNEGVASLFENDDKQFTIFVPDDSAFKDIETELGQLSSEELGRVVTFHFYENIMLSYDELVCSEKLTSMTEQNDASRTRCERNKEGGDITKYQKGNGNTKHGSMPKISKKDIAACNAVLHSIDHLMFPVYLKELHSGS